MTDFCYRFPVFNRVLTQADVMDRMLETLEIDPIDAARCDAGMSWFEARTRCIDCLNDRQCRQWLEQTRRAEAAPEFCANRDFLQQCRQAQTSDE